MCNTCGFQEVKIGEQLQESGENVFVGGKNRWKLSIHFSFFTNWNSYQQDKLTCSICCRYSTFINWEFWWPNFPILVYFKEKQTKPEGQIHFFPIIFVRSFEAKLSQYTHRDYFEKQKQFFLELQASIAGILI